MSVTETYFDGNEAVQEETPFNQSCERKIRKTAPSFMSRYTDYIVRGDVYFADLNPVVGNETGGIRPVVIIQNNVGNKSSTTVIAAITSRAKKQELPVHVALTECTGGLTEDTTILLEQIRTIDKRRLKNYLGHLDDETMKRIDKAVSCSVGISDISLEGGNSDEV